MLYENIFIIWDEEEQNWVAEEGKTENASKAEHMSYDDALVYTTDKEKSYTMFLW